MTSEAIEHYAKKFFPHLLLPHAIECVKEILKAERIEIEAKETNSRLVVVVSDSAIGKTQV